MPVLLCREERVVRRLMGAVRVDVWTGSADARGGCIKVSPGGLGRPWSGGAVVGEGCEG